MLDDGTTATPAGAETGASGAAGKTLRIGFMPLVDSAVLVVAAEKGFAEGEGLALQLIREASWANIRDKVNLGHFDCAQMLAGMPVASTLGIGHVTVPTVAPFALGLGGNAITVSQDLWAAIAAEGVDHGSGPTAIGRALRRVVTRLRSAGAEPLTLAMVFPFSCHNYELRYWLAASDIHPDRDIRLVVIPPALMVESLAAGQIHGFCAGSPWPGLAVDAGLGHTVATKAEIWSRSPEKVLGVRQRWAEENPETLSALLRALNRAAAWVDDPDHREELARLLAQTRYVGADARLILRALAGRLVVAPEGAEREIADFFVFHRDAANFPWQSHALWFYSQMVRWGQVAPSPRAEAAARMVYRPDLYRRALDGADLPMPGASAKVEGALSRTEPVGSAGRPLFLGPDSFFDGRVFDPDDITGYLSRFAMRTEMPRGPVV